MKSTLTLTKADTLNLDALNTAQRITSAQQITSAHLKPPFSQNKDKVILCLQFGGSLGTLSV